MTEIDAIINELIKFRNDRNWEQFHNAKDLSIALSIESSELLELFLWKNLDEIRNISPEKIEEELADIFIYAMLLAEKYSLDVYKIIKDKVEKNSHKYPVEKAKGNAKKYNQL